MGSGQSLRPMRDSSAKSDSATRSSAKANSKNIDKQLSKDESTELKKFKILLLGGSECGKTTIFNQMRVLHANGFDDTDKPQYKKRIIDNTIQSLYQLIEFSKTYMDNVERTMNKDFIPTTEDIMHARHRTTGTVELEFKFKKVNFKIVDVGGQRSERKKWIHVFDNIDMLLFIVSLTEFSQKDPEDEKYNRLKQNRNIFQTAVQSNYFRKSAIVLFLNKYDIFQEQLKYTKLEKWFVEYDGPPRDTNILDDASNFIKNYFQKCVPDRNKFFSFVTTATDTNNVDLVFASSVSYIVNQNLKAAGIHE
uniref:Guanine nucleotide-binding protein alpha-6 subunit n=1 Tax=Rhabditophanes sp. KR3021 TaxID=114890 RepID=A0AC35U5A2_9BILA